MRIPAVYMKVDLKTSEAADRTTLFPPTLASGVLFELRRLW